MRYPRLILREGQSGYPVQALTHLADPELGQVSLWGKTDLWVSRSWPLLAFFCSVHAPASILLAAHDLARAWRQGPVTIVSGFHAPVEEEVLTVLLRGPQPVIVCPARGLADMRLRSEFKAPMADGRLLLISPFSDTVRRATEATALKRNRFVAALADALLIAHANPDSKTERLAQEALSWKKPLYTLDHPANSNLLALGASPYREPGLTLLAG